METSGVFQSFPFKIIPCVHSSNSANKNPFTITIILSSHYSSDYTLLYFIFLHFLPFHSLQNNLISYVISLKSRLQFSNQLHSVTNFPLYLSLFFSYPSQFITFYTKKRTIITLFHPFHLLIARFAHLFPSIQIKWGFFLLQINILVFPNSTSSNNNNNNTRAKKKNVVIKCASY